MAHCYTEQQDLNDSRRLVLESREIEVAAVSAGASDVGVVAVALT